jgi:hypothetical protein
MCFPTASSLPPCTIQSVVGGCLLWDSHEPQRNVPLVMDRIHDGALIRLCHLVTS